MATKAEDELDQGQQGELGEGAQGAEQQDAEVGEGEGGDDNADPVEALALEMGWVPKDQFKGDESAWKPAASFIRDGREIQRDLANNLKAVRSDLDNIRRTSASLVEQQINDRAAQLRRAHAQAVDEGDHETALKIGRAISDVESQAPGNVARGPSSDALAFAEKHSGWFKKEPLATARAVEITNKLAAMGYDESAQLAEAEKAIQREFPHLFGKPNGGKAPPSAHEPGSRSPAPRNRVKGFSDMPKAAQDVAKDMAARKLIPNVDAYVKNYFAIEGNKA